MDDELDRSITSAVEDIDVSDEPSEEPEADSRAEREAGVEIERDKGTEEDKPYDVEEDTIPPVKTTSDVEVANTTSSNPLPVLESLLVSSTLPPCVAPDGATHAIAVDDP